MVGYSLSPMVGYSSRFSHGGLFLFSSWWVIPVLLVVVILLFLHGGYSSLFLPKLGPVRC